MVAKLVVLISGSGTNLQAIIDATAPSKALHNLASIELVVSNRREAGGIQRAKDAGIRTEYQNLVSYGKKFPSAEPGVKYSQHAREEYDKDLAEIVLKPQPTLVVCAGWMHILSTPFLERLEKADVPIINLHPSLPDTYLGANAIERAYTDFKKGEVKKTGVMIHYLIKEVDRGRPIVTQEVEIKEGDQLKDLEERMHAVEHVLIINGIQKALEELPTR